MPRESNLEFKVGAFVVIATITLVAFVLSISDFSVFEKGSTYKAIFQYANGLKKGAPVRVAGVDAGHVRELTIFNDTNEQKTKVMIAIWLMHGVSIPVDSHVMINQLGLLGEKYLEILPGASPQLAAQDSTFMGEDPVPMESIMKMVSGIATKLEGTLTGINDGILTEANKKALTETLENFSAVMGSIRNGEGTVGKLLADKNIYQNLDELTADLKVNPWKLFYRPKGK